MRALDGTRLELASFRATVSVIMVMISCDDATSSCQCHTPPCHAMPCHAMDF